MRNKIRKQWRNRNQRSLRDPQNNSGIRPLPSRESLTQAKGPQDYPVLNLSPLCSPLFQKNAGWSNINTSYPTHTYGTYTHPDHCTTYVLLTVSHPQATQSTMHNSEGWAFFLPTLPLELLVPHAYLSKASSLMPDNRFTLWLSGNCFLSSCRQVCKDVGRGEKPIIVGCN